MRLQSVFLRKYFLGKTAGDPHAREAAPTTAVGARTHNAQTKHARTLHNFVKPSQILRMLLSTGAA